MTDKQGKYIFAYLNPGYFNVRAEREGFLTIEQMEVRVGLGQRIDISFQMKESTQEMITVMSESPLVDLTSTTTATNISDQITRRIPIGRSLADIIYLAPGVVKTPLGNANFSISGASGKENAYIVDGANVTDTGYGGLGARVGFPKAFGGRAVPTEAIKEVQIITAGFEPEYGEAQGGVINVITKAGGNDVHGQGYFYMSPQDAGNELESTNYDLETGAQIGGPILKDKLFFYGAYTTTRSATTYFLDPEWPGYSVLPEAESKIVSNEYSFKLTSNLSSNHSLLLTASGGPTYHPMANQFREGLESYVDPRNVQAELHMGTDSQVLRWNGTFGASLFLEAQIAHAHDWYESTPRFPDLPRIFDRATFLEMGGGGGDIASNSDNTQYSLKLNHLWRNHQFQYGLQFEDISFVSDGYRPGGPFVVTADIILRNGYRVTILPTDPPVYRVFGGINTDGRVPTNTRYLAWFAQDSWNITSNLNVNLGIRWDQQHVEGDPVDAIGVTFSNNWAPRIGVTYDYLKNAKSKLFFHYGRFFERLPNYLGVTFNPTARLQADYANSELTELLPDSLIIFPPGQSGQSKYIPEVEGHGNSESPFETEAQYSDEWSAGLEQEIHPGFSLGARVIFRKLGRVVEDYLVDPLGSCTVISNGSCVLLPIEWEYWAAHSMFTKAILTNIDGHIPGIPAPVRNYRALEFTAEKRLSNRWQLLGSYRYATLIGNYEGGDQNRGRYGDFVLSPTTQFNYEEGPLPNDIRHMVKLFSSYQLMNNLNAGAGLYFQTGRPITAITVIPAFDSAYRLLSPRGAYGRTDSITQVDAHADYSIIIHGNQQLTFGLDVFNIFNAQGVLEVEELAEDGGEPWPYFLDPTAEQEPRFYRFLVRYSF